MQRNRGYFFLTLLCFLLLLNGCATKPPATVRAAPEISPASVVAIWDLENLSIDQNTALSDMNEFLTARVTETLKAKAGFEIIERQKLLLALEELNLGSSALADESSRLEVGKVLGAQLMVFGGYQQVGEQFRVDLRMVEVETGAVVRTGEKTMPAAEVTAWLQAIEAATEGLL